MSDYIVADGSLQTVLAAIRKGASAVLVGNFQITAEDAAPLLRNAVDPASSEIALSPRELMKWSLGHLHPATIANIVNVGLTHNAHTNRLFWRVDENTLIGRFYLMHVIAICPEVDDLVVGSSWDYSFIPELSPSGKVVTLTNSDDYLVVELQPRSYESDNLRPGPITAEELASGLSEWTTAQHRNNVEQTLVFHAADEPSELSEATARANSFVSETRNLLTTPPMPHRDHPYWVGSIAINRRRSNRPLNREDWKFLLGNSAAAAQKPHKALRRRLLGYAPSVTRLHPRWADYALVVQALGKAASANGRILLIATQPSGLAQWVVGETADVLTVSCDQFLQLSRNAYLPLMNSVDACVLLIDEGWISSLDDLLKRAFPLLTKSGLIHILAMNQQPIATAIEFNRIFTRDAARVFQQNVRDLQVHYVPSSRYHSSMRRLLARARSNSPIWLPFIAAAAVPVIIGGYFANSRTKPSRTPPAGEWSSVFLTLFPRPDRFKDDDISGPSDLISSVPASPLKSPPEWLVKAKSEAQARVTSCEDSQQLTITLARYRFAANLIGRQREVAEFGCAHPLGTRLVSQSVKHLSVYDSRTDVVSHLRNEFRADSCCNIGAHDILAAPLSRPEESIYSIDFIKYLSRDEEEMFLRNLRDSLGREHDFLLIGAPSYEGATAGTVTPLRAAAIANATFGRRIYLRSAEELSLLMARHFHSVFMFSMIDDVVRPGIIPKAEFHFALGCTKNLYGAS